MSICRRGDALHEVRQAPRWDDLEAFGIIAEGVANGKNLQEIAEDPTASMLGPRMLYFRLGRLERALGRRLVDRRPWGRTAQLTDAGKKVAEIVSDLRATRRRIEDVVAGAEVPVLRIVTHATLASSLIPAVLRHRRRPSTTRAFHLELTVVASYAHALAAVNEARADVGLYLAFQELDRVPTPRGVRREVLGSSEVVLLVPPTHRFAARARGRAQPVTLRELQGETIIVRGYVDQQLFPAGFPGRRILVPHSLDKLAYVRLGIGVTPLPKLIVDLLGSKAGIVVLPFRPTLAPALCLLRPKKRLRPLGEAVEEFIEELKAACRAACRSSAGSAAPPRIA